jgi:8-oxo-dGTP pyrophosphatase MutT (NUDIX family)
MRFREVPAQQLTRDDERERARFWSRARSDNPALFDGPLLLAADATWEGEICELAYCMGRFSHYLWRRELAEPQLGDARALYVSVMAITADGYLVAGRMAGTTSTPGRIQLPGGNLEADSRDGIVTSDTARRMAAQELAEETGIKLAPSDLRLTHVKTGGDRGDVGVFFSVNLSETLSAASANFLAHSDALRSDGGFVELAELVALWPQTSSAPSCTPATVDYFDDAVRVSLQLDYAPMRYATPHSRQPGVVTIGVGTVGHGS